MGLRRKGREVVLQILYSLDFEHDSLLSEKIIDKQLYDPILNNILEANSIKSDSRICSFSEALLLVVIDNIITIDDLIKTHLEHWTLDKLGILDRNLLRLAVAEIVFQKTPPAIVIDEALEIAKKYCCDQTGKLLNGVLDHIARDLDQRSSKV